VLFLAESDPVGSVDVGGESSSAPGTALACPEFVDNFDAAPLWIEKKFVVCEEWTAHARDLRGTNKFS
jgi:hypothetical protein